MNKINVEWKSIINNLLALFFMVIIRDESLVKKAIDFASNALDADEIFQLTHISLSGRKAVEKRIEEIKGNNFYS